jgi:hypothetical protein
MSSLFQLSTSLSSVATIQHYQPITFHNSLVILALLSSTVVFWTELGCWAKSTQTRVIPRSLQKIIRSSIAQIVMNFPFTKMSFFFYPQQNFYWTWLWVTGTANTSRAHVFTLCFLVRSVLLVFFFFFWFVCFSCLFCVQCFLSPWRSHSMNQWQNTPK